MSLFKENFVGKKVLVTGAGKGIGRAVTVQLHENGAIVYALSRTKSDLDSLVEECPKVVPILVDISDWDKTREALIKGIPGHVDVLVNNAGVATVEPFMSITSKGFDNTININLKAVVNVSQYCASKMIEANVGGTIVNISSTYAIRPGLNFSIYNASKAAVDSLTKTMARELGPHGINVVAMNLGYIDTPLVNKLFGSEEAKRQFEEALLPQLPQGEVCIPMEQVVNSILFVASGLVGMMTGSGFILDGGYCAN